VVDLGLLSGSKGKAAGTVTALGPRVGSGRICFDEKNISVQADAVDRTETWLWQLSGADAQGCLFLEQGSVNTDLKISAGNSVTANSANIIAQVPVTFYSDNEPNRTIEQTLEINLQSIKLINKTAERAVLILLTLLGIALPLLLLYLMNFLTTKISMGRQLQRGVFDVSLDSEGKIHALRQGVQSQMTASMDDFKFLPEMKDVRQYNDGLVEIRAKVSKFALLASWYEIKAPANYLVFTMTPKLNRLTKRFKTGAKTINEIFSLGENLEGVEAADYQGLQNVTKDGVTYNPNKQRLLSAFRKNFKLINRNFSVSLKKNVPVIFQ
jgi:hypothetical protein